MSTTTKRSGIESSRPIEYPESDGEPLGETDFHIAVILYLRQALRHHFRLVPDLYVAADMLLYFEEGDPTQFKVPDVFVCKGVPKHDRRTYKLWEEAAPPCVIFEISSRKTRLEDVGTKRALYELIGVREYFVFDPLDEYLQPRLQGFTLVGGAYERMELADGGRLTSQELGLTLVPDGARLRLIDPVTGRPLPDLDEAVARADEEARRADEEARRAEEQSRRAEEQSRRAEEQSRRAEEQSARAEEQSARAEEQSRRADEAEAENARLRTEIDRLGGGKP